MTHSLGLGLILLNVSENNAISLWAQAKVQTFGNKNKSSIEVDSLRV